MGHYHQDAQTIDLPIRANETNGPAFHAAKERAQWKTLTKL
jgi:hypothetical protein